MIDLFTSALSDCQNAFSILCEVFYSIEEVTLSIVHVSIFFLGGGGWQGRKTLHVPPSLPPLDFQAKI